MYKKGVKVVVNGVVKEVVRGARL